MIKNAGGAWSGVQTYAPGACSQTQNRAGDYAGAQTDPSNLNSFWLAGEQSVTISGSLSMADPHRQPGALGAQPRREESGTATGHFAPVPDTAVGNREAGAVRLMRRDPDVESVRHACWPCSC